jgi:hypothetical protein
MQNRCETHRLPPQKLPKNPSGTKDSRSETPDLVRQTTLKPRDVPASPLLNVPPAQRFVRDPAASGAGIPEIGRFRTKKAQGNPRWHCRCTT